MNETYEKLLQELFDELDSDASGFLDVRAFVLLGQAVTGQKVTTQEAKLQLDRADHDGDDMVSRQEWLEFSSMLFRLDNYHFSRLISGYISNVRKIRKENAAAFAED